MPSKLWDLENGVEDGGERKKIEGRHNKEEADERKKTIVESSSFSGLKA